MEPTSVENKPAATESAKAPEAGAKPAKPAKTKKKGGFLRSCLLFFLVLFLVLGALAAWVLRVPQKLGLMGRGAARLTEETPERGTAQDIVAEAEARGFKSAGVEVYVLPKADADEAMLYAVYDFSKEGVTLSKTGPHQPVIDTMEVLAGGAKAEEEKITHVGVEFRDERGKLVLIASAATADVRALRDGKMTEEEFKKKLGIRVDLPGYINRAVVPF
ncbi:MAG TPA: hypothetical protein VL500_06020 [Candidatus Eisenbacteria bacterium]|nr:hypothetical protein [Candidatus Eisenbacteria bacterium]